MRAAPFFLFLLSPALLFASERRCLEGSNALDRGTYLRVTKRFAPQPEIRTGGVDAPFVQDRVEAGDCVVFSSEEQFTATVVVDRFPDSFWNRFVPPHRTTGAFLPAVLYRAKDGSKRFGVLAASALTALTKDASYRETTTKDLLDYAPAPNDLLIVYVVCPRDRDEACRVTVKDRGRWVLDEKTKRPWTAHVLARSFRNRGMSRQQQEGDTPQGIYYLWATMLTRGSRFGGVPRIDLDASSAPVNATPYPIHSTALSQLLPEKSWEEYWANEWALAYSLGRSELRIHTSVFDAASNEAYTTPHTKLSFMLTNGCLNSGADHDALFAVLRKRGVVTSLDAASLGEAETTWKVSPRIGKAFVIVKDE